MSTTQRKYILLALLLAATLMLTACYVETDDTTTGMNNQNTGNNALPFDTVAPTATATPTPAPTQQTGENNLGNVNWEDAWGDTPTNAPQGGNVVTMPPSLGGNTGGIAVTTASPTATPTRTASTSGSGDSTSTSLKAGATGSEVSEVQQRLKDLKYYTGSVDGKYGSGTVNAVMAFQETNGLKADGIVGKQTKEKLFSYNAIASSGKSGTSSATAKPTAKATATPNLSKARYLKLDMSGTDVKQLQLRLIDLGYLSGSADGKYGTATEAAVTAFQKRTSGLYDDGIAGPDTQKALYASDAKRASGAPALLNQTLELGAEGDAVRALQDRLIKLKYMSGYSDGSYGEKTKTAVEAFQRNNGLSVDGKAGATTLAALYADTAVNAGGTSASGSSGASSSSGDSTGYVTLKEGDKGDGVKKLQQRLKELGYYSGTVDGSFGSGTLAAVRSYQEMNKLTVDGKAGPATQRAIFGTNAAVEDTSKSLQLGDEGAKVTNLQYALYELGYYQDKVNGIYTQNTANAVREFQMNNGLKPVDGIAGSNTLAMLYSPLAKSALSETVNFITLSVGSTGEEVVQVQQALFDYGYMNRRATGVYDEETYAAVAAFQARNGLGVDGVAGEGTQIKLFSDSVVRAQ